MVFGRSQNGVFRQNELFHVIQHGKTHGNHRGHLGKTKKLEKWSTLLDIIPTWMTPRKGGMTYYHILCLYFLTFSALSDCPRAQHNQYPTEVSSYFPVEHRVDSAVSDIRIYVLPAMLVPLSRPHYPKPGVFF